MATDCYKLFKTTYAQAVADGLPTAAAQLAAQTAMNSCLGKQNSTPSTVAQPLTGVSGTRVIDAGPVKPRGK
jgi:hypothetical protein